MKNPHIPRERRSGRNRRLARFLFRLLGRLNERLQPKSFFFIRPGYHHAVKAQGPSSISRTGHSPLRQIVSEIMANDTAAGLLVFSRHAPSLQEYGMPAGPVTWVLHPEQVLPEFSPAECRYLTFSDAAGQTLRAKCVIVEQMAECFANPDDLFDLIDDMEFEFLILSAGERDASGGRNDYGPPANAAHYREWNSVEFKNYLRGWFKLTEHRIFNGESLLQVVICQKK